MTAIMIAVMTLILGALLMIAKGVYTMNEICKRYYFCRYVLRFSFSKSVKAALFGGSIFKVG